MNKLDSIGMQLEQLVSEQLEKIEKMDITEENAEKAIKNLKILTDSMNETCRRETDAEYKMNEQTAKNSEREKKFWKRIEPRTYILVGTAISLTVFSSIFEAKGFILKDMPKLAEKLLFKG